jgi:putative MATE family efflux protein
MTAHADPRKADLTQGPIRPHLVRLTLPMTWGLMAMISFQLVDTWYVSMLGSDTLTAISFTFPVTYGVFSLMLGLGIAVSSVLSRQIGAGKILRVRRLTGHALLLAAIMGVFLSVLGLALNDRIFRAMGADDQMLRVIRQFMIPWFAGSLFVNAPMVGNAIMRAGGDTRTPARIMVAAAIANALIDPVLIFGLLGAPRLGVAGAAIATVFSSVCGCAASLYIIAVRRRMIRLRRHHWRLLGDSAKRFLFIALPVGITGALAPLTGAVVTALLARMDAAGVAAYGIATRIEAFLFIVIMALASGMAPLIGQNHGAGRFERVNETMRGALAFASLWSLGAALLLFTFARPVARLFTDDPAIIEAAVLYFRLVPLSYVAGNAVQGWCSAFNAMGLPKKSFAMIVTRLVLLTIPLAWIGGRLFGMTGIFAAIAAANFICGAIFHWRSRRFCLARVAMAG